MKFLTLADWTGTVEPELFAQTYKNYGLATLHDVDKHGLFSIIDIECLPPEAPEADAINWNATEVSAILRSCGYAPQASNHQKAILVWAIEATLVSPDKDSRKQTAGLVLQLLEKKLSHLLDEREAKLHEPRPSSFSGWITQCAAIARHSEAIRATRKMLSTF